MSQHHPAILPQILRLFSQLHLEVLKIHTEDHLDVDHDVFFCEVEQNFGPDLPDLAVVRYGVSYANESIRSHVFFFYFLAA